MEQACAMSFYVAMFFYVMHNNKQGRVPVLGGLASPLLFRQGTTCCLCDLALFMHNLPYTDWSV